jgi:hypothetical protein
LQDEINKKIQKADAEEEVKDEDLDEEAEKITTVQLAIDFAQSKAQG